MVKKFRVGQVQHKVHECEMAISQENKKTGICPANAFSCELFFRDETWRIGRMRWRPRPITTFFSTHPMTNAREAGNLACTL